MLRTATVNDLESIISILKSVGSSHKDPNRGFLMNDYTQREAFFREKYSNYLRSLTYRYVYEEDEKVTGFLLAFTKEEWLEETPSWIENIYWRPDFNQIRLDRFVLINQTAMYPGKTGRGIGSLLYMALLDDLKTNGCFHVFAETIVAPIPNIASLNFRLKQKYELAGVRYEEAKDTVFTTLVYYKPVSYL